VQSTEQVSLFTLGLRFKRGFSLWSSDICESVRAITGNTHATCDRRQWLGTGCYTAVTYLPLLGRGKPSSVHAICGVGLPAELHFRDTAGPGCRVCSIKLYSRTGGASETTQCTGSAAFVPCFKYVLMEFTERRNWFERCRVHDTFFMFFLRCPTQMLEQYLKKVKAASVNVLPNWYLKLPPFINIL
jgi:hypothetical protein